MEQHFLIKFNSKILNMSPSTCVCVATDAITHFLILERYMTD